MADHRKRWFTQIIQSALEEELVSADKVLQHVTPDVMANHLPPSLMSAILKSSLSAGAMRPELVLATLNPEVLAEHVPHQVLWACMAEAGTEAGMEDGSGGVGPLRRFLESAIASGLDYGMVSEDEVLVEITPEILAEHMPVPLKAALLRACFEADKVNPELVVRTLGVGNLAEHSPIPQLWKIVTTAGYRAAGGRDVEGKAPDAMFIPEVTAPPAPEAPLAIDTDVPGPDDITRNGVADDGIGGIDAPIAVDPTGDDRRKPNRRVTGAGATSRRRRRDTGRALTQPDDLEVDIETDIGVE